MLGQRSDEARAPLEPPRRRWVPAAFALAVIALSVALTSGIGIAASTAAPANTTEPAITGTAALGSTLTASQGTWTNSPTSFTYQWVRCPTSGGDPLGATCAVIGGATGSAYVIASADTGARLRVRVTAANASGSGTSASNATPVVGAAVQAPRNTAEPTIAGIPRVGSTLTATNGSWSGSPTSFSYRWYSCPSSGGRSDATDCTALGGATAQSYAPAAGTVGRRLRVRVTAANASGSTSAVSNATATVQAAAAATGCPSGTGPIAVSQLTSPARLLVDGQSIVPSPVGRSSTVVTMRFRVSACGGRPVQGALVYATAVPYNQYAVPPEQLTGADGWAQLTTSQGRAFPAAEQQQLLVVFVRARKPGENVLAGISTRRLVSFPVALRR